MIRLFYNFDSPVPALVFADDDGMATVVNPRLMAQLSDADQCSVINDLLAEFDGRVHVVPHYRPVLRAV